MFNFALDRELRMLRAKIAHLTRTVAVSMPGTFAVIALADATVIGGDGRAVEQVAACDLQFIAALRRACTARAQQFELRQPSITLAHAAALSGCVHLLGGTPAAAR